MSDRTLSEIAYDTAYVPGIDISERTIDAALEEAGIDPSDNTERIRFVSLVRAAQPLKKEDHLARCSFAAEAREKCGSGASTDELIYHAYGLEEQHKPMTECE